MKTKYCTDKIQGVIVAVPTFYDTSYGVDFSAMKRYLTWLFSFKIQGVVMCGTTGEGMAQSPEEYKDLIRLAVDLSKDRVHVIGGTFGVVSRMVIQQIQWAKEAGAQSALVLSPHYIKPDQEGLFQHYEDIHAHTVLPMIIYNNRTRTGTSIDPETVYRLSQLNHVVGIKDSTSDMMRIMTYGAKVQKKNWTNLCGEDGQFLPYLACGGTGIISVAAGVNPRAYQKIWHAWQEGDWHSARKHAFKVMPLAKALGCASNPAPVKYALERLGFGDSLMRYHLGMLDEKGKRDILAAMPQCRP